jgi:hypothetical protein
MVDKDNYIDEIQDPHLRSFLKARGKTSLSKKKLSHQKFDNDNYNYKKTHYKEGGKNYYERNKEKILQRAKERYQRKKLLTNKE